MAMELLIKQWQYLRRRSMKGSWIIALAVVVIGLVPVTANAITITDADIHKTFDVDWYYPASGSLTHDLSAKATFEIISFDSSDLVLSVTIWNTTPDADTADWNEAILSFGIGVDPDVTATFIDAGDVFDHVEIPNQQQFPGGFKNIDICIFASNGCSGGNINLGLKYGGEDSFILNLHAEDTFGTSPTATLEPFPIKFQTAQGSFEFDGDDDEEPGPPVVPEPTSLLLLGSGLAALGLVAWKKKSKQ